MADTEDLSLERVAFDTEREGFDLFRAACLLPRIEGREPDVRHCVEQVEAMGRALKQRLPRDEDGHARELVAHLFGELGFDGDRSEYDAPSNSFLVDVIERRRGLPVALSLLTVAVAEAAGMRAFGVALPRHFIVGVSGARGFSLIDPFNKGRTLDADDIEGLTGVGGLDVVGHAVAQTSPRAILMRMLANLHGSYLRRGDREPLVRVLSRMLLFEPRHPALLVQRAQVRVEVGEFAEARLDIQTALGLSPDVDVKRAAEEMLRRLDEGQRYLN